MSDKYCVDCMALERRPTMAETHMDSGEYVQTGWHYRCNHSDRKFPDNERDIEFRHCTCGKFTPKQ